MLNEIEKLPSPFKEIVQKSYNHDNPQTLVSIGIDLNLSTERVRQLLVQATKIIKGSKAIKSFQKDI